MIFHQTIFHKVGEKKIISVTRTFVLLTSLMSNIFDSFGEGGHVYNYLTDTVPKEDPGYDFRIVKLIIVINLIFLVFVQVKIELFKRAVDQQIGAIELQVEENVSSNMTTFRIVGAIGFVFMVISLTFMANVSIINEFISRIAVQVVITIFLPSFVFYKNQNFHEFCIKTLCFWK